MVTLPDRVGMRRTTLERHSITVIYNSQECTENSSSLISCSICWDTNQICPPFITKQTLQTLNNQPIYIKASARFINGIGQHVKVLKFKTIEEPYFKINVGAWRTCRSDEYNSERPTVWIAQLIRNALKRHNCKLMPIRRHIFFTATVHERQWGWETQRTQHWSERTKCYWNICFSWSWAWMAPIPCHVRESYYFSLSYHLN